MSDESGMDKLRAMRRQVRQGGGPERVKRHHAKGKLTARERVDGLLDRGSFQEIGMFVTHRTAGFGLEEKKDLGDSVVTDRGRTVTRTFAYSKIPSYNHNQLKGFLF